MNKNVLLVCCLTLFIGCTYGDEDSVPPLGITPESGVGYLGQRFVDIEPSLKDKMAYFRTKAYPDFVNIEASVQAMDPAAPVQKYKLTLRCGSDNNINAFALVAFDSVGRAQGDSNFLYFYQRALAQATGVTNRQQWVAQPYTPDNAVTVDSLLKALQAGNAPRPSLTWQTDRGTMKLEYAPANYGIFFTVNWPQ